MGNDVVNKLDVKKSSKKLDLDLFGGDDEEEEDTKNKTNVINKLDVKKSSKKLDLNMFEEEDEKKDEEGPEIFGYGLRVEVVGCDNLNEADDLVAAEDSFWSFIIGWLGFMLYLVVGASIFTFVEDANFVDMIWFFVVTTCTVGYGDVYPLTSAGKILTPFLSRSAWYCSCRRLAARLIISMRDRN